MLRTEPAELPQVGRLTELCRVASCLGVAPVSCLSPPKRPAMLSEDTGQAQGLGPVPL